MSLKSSYKVTFCIDSWIQAWFPRTMARPSLYFRNRNDLVSPVCSLIFLPIACRSLILVWPIPPSVSIATGSNVQ